MENLEIQYRKTSDLIPYARNARKHSDPQVRQIAASIKEFGFNTPILVDSKDMIIAGHGRILAAEILGLEAVPVVRLKHLSDIQGKAYNIVDNQLALNAEWDMELLKLEVQELDSLDFDLEVLGFDDLDVLLDPIPDMGIDTKVGEGSKELSEDDFSDFDRQCPKCGFEFDDKK